MKKTTLDIKNKFIRLYQKRGIDFETQATKEIIMIAAEFGYNLGYDDGYDDGFQVAIKAEKTIKKPEGML